jgi:hypothetical protein
MDSTLPPIFQLPNELQFEILSLVIPSLLPSGFEPHIRKPTRLTDSPFHTVRSTCRTLRWIVDELPFWSDASFDISQIEHFDHDDGSDSVTIRAPPSDNMEALLSDAHLQQCLSLKTVWRVKSPAVFSTLSRKLPHFGQSLQDLGLCHGDRLYSWINVTNLLRHTCPTLKKLFIMSTAHIHLNTLPHTLQELDIKEFSESDCSCKNDLPNLLEFVFLLPRIPTEADLERILPFNSKKTLEHLDLNLEIQPRDNVSPIYQFENLKHLALPGANAATLRSLVQCPFRLEKFGTEQMDDILAFSPALIELFNSPVLRDLEDFHLGIYVPTMVGTTEQQIKYGALLREIAHLPALRYLRLSNYPLRIDWLHHFRESNCLKSVRWVCFHYRQLVKDEFEDQPKDVDLEEALRQILPRSSTYVRIINIE